MSFTLQITLATGPDFEARLREAVTAKHGDVAVQEVKSATAIAMASVHNDRSAPAKPENGAAEDVTAWENALAAHVAAKVTHVEDVASDMLEACIEAAGALAMVLAARGIKAVAVQLVGHVETDPAHVGFLNVHVWPG
ncbi:MAG TPA: hypothetical protein VEZ44_05490 [bacterium]|nr:hypothetical protein [bacterium]